MHRIEVGQLLQEDKTRYPEGCHFNFTATGADLIMALGRPEPEEIQQIKKGMVRLGMYTKEDLIFLLFKFGTMNWIDAPYTVHLGKDFEFQSLEEGMGYSLHIYLVDANTGIVKAIRLIGMPTRFSKILRNAIDAQRGFDFDQSEYDKKLNSVLNNYSTDDFVSRADITCKAKE